MPALTEAEVGGATATFYSWMEGDSMAYELSITSECACGGEKPGISKVASLGAERA